MIQRTIRVNGRDYLPHVIDQAREQANACVRELKEHGWNQRSYGNKRVGFCMLGVLNKVQEDEMRGHAYGSKGRADVIRANTVASAIVYELVYEQDEQKSMAKWNDDPGRTKAQVLTMFRRASRRLLKLVRENNNA